MRLTTSRSELTGSRSWSRADNGGCDGASQGQGGHGEGGCPLPRPQLRRGKLNETCTLYLSIPSAFGRSFGMVLDVWSIVGSIFRSVDMSFGRGSVDCSVFDRLQVTVTERVRLL